MRPKKNKKTDKKPKTWLTTGFGNSFLRGGGFYVSYSPSPLLNLMGHASNETALFKEGEPWRILSGDFRKEYEAVIDKGFAACLRVYKKFSPKYRNGHSTD